MSVGMSQDTIHVYDIYIPCYELTADKISISSMRRSLSSDKYITTNKKHKQQEFEN